MKEKPTAFEVWQVAKQMWETQSGHISNWKPLISFVPAAVERLLEISKQIDKEYFK